MTCSDFVARFSDHLDGSSAPEEAARLEAHLDACASCRRYRHVVQEGASLLRSLPTPEVPEDFESRLRHRIYHADAERALAEHASSGASAFAVLGIAVLLAGVAWSPVLLDPSTVVELDPIVVDRSPSLERPTFASAQSVQSGADSSVQLTELWDGARLYEYSPLFQRYASSDAGARLGLGR